MAIYTLILKPSVCLLSKICTRTVSRALPPAPAPLCCTYVVRREFQAGSAQSFRRAPGIRGASSLVLLERLPLSDRSIFVARLSEFLSWPLSFGAWPAQTWQTLRPAPAPLSAAPP